MWTHIRSRNRPVRGHTRRFFPQTYVKRTSCPLGPPDWAPCSSSRRDASGGVQTSNPRRQEVSSTKVCGKSLRVWPRTGQFRDRMWVHIAQNGFCVPPPVSHHCTVPPPTAPSCEGRPRAVTSGVQRDHDDPRVIVPARRLLLQRRVGGCWNHLAARLEAPRRAAISPTRPPVRRVCRPSRRAQVRCAVEWRPLLWASRDAGGLPPLRWRRRHPFPPPTVSPRRQRGCACPRARLRLWSRSACPVSMRRPARHRPEGRGIAHTWLEYNHFVRAKEWL